MKRIDGTWIYFQLLFDINETRKTQVWQVMAKQGDIELGGIKWHTAWRTYAFYPNPSTIYEDDCLTEISSFINKLMNLRWRTKYLKKERRNA